MVLQTPIVCDELILDAASCAELTPIQFHNVVRHFSPTSLDIDRCRLRAYQITDGFLGDLRTNRVRQIVFQNMVPLDGVSFHATDDAIIDFCVQEDVPTFDQEDTCPLRLHQELVVCNGTFTKGLFKRLVQVNTRCSMYRTTGTPKRNCNTTRLRMFVHTCKTGISNLSLE